MSAGGSAAARDLRVLFRTTWSMAMASPPDRDGAHSATAEVPLELLHWAMRPDLIPGARLPDLTISNHSGEPVTLSKLAGGLPLILSFYRGYW